MFGALKRSFTEFSEDNMTDWAGALTYFGLLSLFPALIALVSIFGFFADPASATKTITDIVSKLGPSSAAQTFKGPVQSITQNQSAAGIFGIVGVVLALLSASKYVGAFMRASNIIFETPEGRPIWKLRPLQMLVTLILLLLAIVVILGLVLSGPLADAIGSALGISGTAITIFQIAKWPFIAAFVVLMFVVLYYASPNVKQRSPKAVVPGAVFALVAWILASVAFAFYVANFASFGATYGSLGGVVVFLMWLWITNNAILLGGELNAELERGRELDSDSVGAERELKLEPRDEPKEPKTAGGQPEGRGGPDG